MAAINESTVSQDPSLALFENQVQGLVVALRAHERPLQGLAGILDWHFHGEISRCLKAGFLKAEPGECTYLPITRFGTVYHLLLVGAGSDGTIPAESLRALKKNLSTLKLNPIGISRSDWNSEELSKQLKATSGVQFIQ